MQRWTLLSIHVLTHVAAQLQVILFLHIVDIHLFYTCSFFAGKRNNLRWERTYGRNLRWESKYHTLYLQGCLHCTMSMSEAVPTSRPSGRPRPAPACCPVSRHLICNLRGTCTHVSGWSIGSQRAVARTVFPADRKLANVGRKRSCSLPPKPDLL